MNVYDGASGQFVANYNPFSPTVLADVTGEIYEPLFYFNNQSPLGTPPVSLLGQSYAWNAAGTVLSITTKSGVKWSDGQPFTANDVAFTFKILDNNPSLDTVGDGPVPKVIDNNHLTLTFKKPAFTDGPSYLGKTFIVPEHIWKNKTDFATDINSNPIGTGPMKFSSFTPESYLLVKNANYRGASTMAVKGVRVMSLSGNQAATNELLAGQLDWSGIFIPNVTQVLKAAPAVSLSATGNQQIVLHTCSNVQLGCTGPQTDTVVRHAIALAMDRTQINKLAYFGRGSAISPTYGIIGRDNKFISSAYPAESMTPNITAADSLLAADGWVKGSDGIYAKNGTRLSMNAVVTSGYTDYIAVLSVLTQQLKAAGIEITTSQAANAEVISDQTLGKFQIAIGSVLQGPVGDPYYLYDSNYSSVGVTAVGKVGNPYGDLTKFVNPAVNAALTKAASTTNIATKTAAYATIQSAIVADMPDIPVLNNTNFAEFSSANYTGWPTFQNQYASADPGAGPSNEVVLAHLTAK